MKQLFYLFISLLLLQSCFSKSKQVEPLPSESIFNLSSQWQNQNGDTLQLTSLHGKTMVVVMIYTSCKTACPRLVAKMKEIELKIKKQNLDGVSLVLVSIDPETDTPEHLNQFARDNDMVDPQWIFLRGNENATQEFANVLAMKYKKISPVDFSHSNIISVFSPDGRLVSQEEGIEIDVEKVVATVNKTVQEAK